MVEDFEHNVLEQILQESTFFQMSERGDILDLAQEIWAEHDASVHEKREVVYTAYQITALVRELMTWRWVYQLLGSRPSLWRWRRILAEIRQQRQIDRMAARKAQEDAIPDIGSALNGPPRGNSPPDDDDSSSSSQLGLPFDDDEPPEDED
jgi:hypothetical protein